MAGTRKDARGYKLNTGEYQRKDGRYMYSYTERGGKRRTVYANSLADLRKKETKIRRDTEDGMDAFHPEKITLNELYDRYISHKHDLKPTTRTGYIYFYDHFVREGFGKRKITEIRYSDVKEFYYSLILEKHLKANTLDCVHRQLHPAFQTAVRDDLLRKNPTEGIMAEIKRSHLWENPKKHSLTELEQKALTEFLRNNREFHGWAPIIMVLMGTGMRIGECLGLRWDDLDFEKRVISVNHNLTEVSYGRGMGFKHIQTPKTRAGARTIPMIDEVQEAFLEEYLMQKCLDLHSETIDGYTNFIFLTEGGRVITARNVNRGIKRIVAVYNKEETARAKEEGREEVLLPDFSAHILRHTFCTRLCENNMNLKAIQSIMGHSDFSTTMDIYTDITDEKKQKAIEPLQGKIIF